MAVRDILRLGDPGLLARSEPVTDPSVPEIADLIADMCDTLAAAHGAGLAAPQIGVLKRVILISVPSERITQDPEAQPLPVTVLINPSITPQGTPEDESSMENGWEGCLSIPGLLGVVPRYQTIRYEGLDQNGQPVCGQATGFHARVLQHECDHLDGILYPMRMRNLAWLSFSDQIDKIVDAQARRDSAGLPPQKLQTQRPETQRPETQGPETQ